MMMMIATKSVLNHFKLKLINLKTIRLKSTVTRPIKSIIIICFKMIIKTFLAAKEKRLLEGRVMLKDMAVVSLVSKIEIMSTNLILFP